MKNLSTVLNVVLLIAVSFLFYKVYSDKQPVMAQLPPSDGKSTIVFVNADSLFEKYDLFNDVKDKFEKEKDSIDNILKSRAAYLEKEVGAYRNAAQGMTGEERARTEEALMGKQQMIVDMKQQLYGQLQDKEDAMDDSVHRHLTGYLKEFNKDKKYAFIFGFQKGSGILFASDSLDITKQVLIGLNKK